MNNRLIIKIGVLLVAYTIFTLGHDFFGRTLAAAWDIDNRDQFNAKFNWIALLLSISTLSFFFYYLKKNPNYWLIKISYLVLVLLLMYFSLEILLVVHSEIIHFPQYALLALLLFPIIKNLPETLFLTIVLGLIDECYQYFMLAPQKTAYLDFNDMWLNTLGGGLGILLAGLVFTNSLNPKKKYLTFNGLIFKGTLTTAIIFALLFLSGFLGYNQEMNPNALYYLIREQPKSFWTSSDFNVEYHIMRPTEGILAIGFLFWLFFPLEKYFKKVDS